ncbi:MAG TPA: MBL fold metallo-hydrolase [Stellaceae bacterium]|nr:MBL fold metallo-hydrolase [Stellaceae bacterium]
MFELVFLGTAATAPAAERGLPALVVVAGPHRLLVDCGEGTQRQLMRARLGFRGLSHVLLTHPDLDHVLGLAGLIATLSLYGLGGALEIVGSEEAIAFVRRYLADTVGNESRAGYRLRAAAPGRVLSAADWHLDAFAVGHRGKASLGYLFAAEHRRPLLPERLAALGVPSGPERAALARGETIVLADGRRIRPEMVQGGDSAGARLAIIGDAAETEALIAPVRGADLLVIEATFLARDAELARQRRHLTAAEAARLARDAGVGALVLNHISGRYRAEEIAAEAAAIFAETRVAADFDHIRVAARPRTLDADRDSDDNPQT